MNLAAWITQYLNRHRELLAAVNAAEVEKIIELFGAGHRRGAQFFVFGNGGSAASASHLATDLGKGASDKMGAPFKILSLNDNTPWMTAIGNDYSYEDVFQRQMRNFAKPGDVAMCMSVSGNSPNLVKAMRWARENAVVTIALVGGKRGALAETAEHVLVVPDTHYGRVEDVHMTICHLIAYAFMETVG